MLTVTVAASPWPAQQQCVSSGSLRVTLVTWLWAWSGLYPGAPGGLSTVITIVLVVTLGIVFSRSRAWVSCTISLPNFFI